MSWSIDPCCSCAASHFGTPIFLLLLMHRDWWQMVFSWHLSEWLCQRASAHWAAASTFETLLEKAASRNQAHHPASHVWVMDQVLHFWRNWGEIEKKWHRAWSAAVLEWAQNFKKSSDGKISETGAATEAYKQKLWSLHMRFRIFKFFWRQSTSAEAISNWRPSRSGADDLSTAKTGAYIYVHTTQSHSLRMRSKFLKSDHRKFLKSDQTCCPHSIHWSKQGKWLRKDQVDPVCQEELEEPCRDTWLVKFELLRQTSWGT